MRAILLPVVAAAALLGPAIAYAWGDTPLSTVKALYQQQVKGDDDYTVPLPTGPELRGEYFSSRLVALLDADDALVAETGEIACLDFDPVYNAQDIGPRNFRMTDQGKGRVRVDFDNGGRPQALLYTLVEEGSVWKVDDIENVTDPAEGWVLSQILDCGL